MGTTALSHPAVYSKWPGILLAGAVLFAPSYAEALPEDGTVVEGSAQIVAKSATELQIIQQSDRVTINWGSFNIGANEAVLFIQNSSLAQALNRVIEGGASQILGRLTASGQIILSNPAGINFGATAVVDVHSLIATTANVRTPDFMAGRLNFDEPGNPGGAVINRGRISVAEGGLAALVAPGVENAGVINARLGKVSLASAEAFTVDLYGDGLIRIAVDRKVLEAATGIDGKRLEALASNSGTIEADGGVVQITANAASNILDNVINMSGTVRVRTVEMVSGEIVLSGGDSGVVNVSGTIDGAGREPGQTGGTVKVLGDRVALMDGTRIDVSGDAGGGQVLVGGNFQGKGTEPNAIRTYVSGDAVIEASAISGGDGGRVIVWADDGTAFNGTVNARGGAETGNGGFVEISGKQNLSFRGNVDLSAPVGEFGTLLLDPRDILISGGTGDGTADSDAATNTFGGATAGTVLFGEFSGSVTVRESEVEGLNANIVLEASHSVTASGTFSNSRLDVVSGRNLTVRTRNNPGDETGSAQAAGINLTGIATVRTQGGGSITMATGTGASSGSGSVANLSTGALTTAGGTLTLNANNGGVITTGAIITTGAANQAGGAVTVTGSAGVTVGGAITASGGTSSTGNPGRNAGAVGITGGDVTVAAITASGTAGVGTNQNGGTGGAITLDATDGSPTITLGGGLTAAGGARTGMGTAGDGGAITVSDPTTLTAAVTANASGAAGGGAGGGIAFSGAIDGNTAGTRALTLTGGTGDVTVSGGIGATNALSALTVTGNDISFANIGSSGTTGVTGALSMTAATSGGDTGSIALSGVTNTGGTQTYAGTGLPLSIGGNLITTNQNITIGNPLSLTAAAEISAGTATIALNSTADAGNNALTLSANEINLTGNITGTSALTLRPGSTTATLDVAAAANTTNNELDLTTAELALIQAGFSGVTLGRNDSTANVTVNAISAGTLKSNSTIATGSGTISLAGDVTNSGTAITFDGAAQLPANRTISTSGGNIAFTGAVTGNAAGRTLTLQPGVGNVTVTGNAGTSGTRLGTVTANGSGTVSFLGTLFGSALTLSNASTASFSGAVNLTGAATVPGTVSNAAFLDGLIANSVSFLNTGTLRLGDAAGDTTTITSGLNTTGVGGAVTLGGTVQTTNQQIDLGAVTLGSATTLTAGSAALNVGAVTGGGNGLTVQGSGAATLASASNLGTLALAQSGGSATVTGNLSASALTTAANNYAVALNGGTTSVTGDTTFTNTGALTLGDGGDSLTFAGGLDTTGVGGAVTLGGTVQTTNQQLDLGAVTLGSATTLTAGSAALNVGAVTGGGNDLTVTTDTIGISGNLTGTGAWTFQPETVTRTIGLAGAAGGFALDTAELARISNGSSSLVTIGRSDGTGAITANAFSFDDPLTLRGGAIGLQGTLTKPVGALTLIGAGAITGNLSLALGTGVFRVTGNSAVLTGIVDGLSGASASNKSLKVGALGPGPFTINGATIPSEPPTTPSELIETAKGVTNNQVAAVVKRRDADEAASVSGVDIGGPVNTPSRAAFAGSATSQPYLVQLSFDRFSLSTQVPPSPTPPGGPPSAEGVGAEQELATEMEGAVDDVNEYLRNFTILK